MTKETEAPLFKVGDYVRSVGQLYGFGEPKTGTVTDTKFFEGCWRYRVHFNDGLIFHVEQRFLRLALK